MTEELLMTQLIILVNRGQGDSQEAHEIRKRMDQAN